MSFIKQVLRWFNRNNNDSTFDPSVKEVLFGILDCLKKEIVRKLNYTLLCMKYHIYSSKLNENALILSEFVSKIIFKFKLERV